MRAKSSKTIIEHIPLFLNYCREEGLSDNTQRNYQRYLNKFIFWLKRTNKENLKPHQLTTDDIWEYRLFLSRNIDPKTGKSLRKTTQNYYLIALRALLSYFSARDVICLLVDKIKLLRAKESEKPENYYLNQEQVEELLSLPNTKREVGLRDRLILEILISTGLKIRQLTSLDRDWNVSKDIYFPKKVLPWIKRYLDTRKDKNKALFVNYRSRRDADKRLTARSVERIVNKYGRFLNLPFSLTPEILRWARLIALLNEETKPRVIHRPYAHRVVLIKKYKHEFKESDLLKPEKRKNTSSSPWHLIETIINQEIAWLRSNISVLPSGYKNNPLLLDCDDCILRKLAVLIVSGKVKATEYRSKNERNLWYSIATKKADIPKISRHGKEWHRKMMDVINRYFEMQNYEVIQEPILNYGRSDLEIHSSPKKRIYIEIGTVSLYKIWFNLSTMKNITFLIVSTEEKVIELRA